MPLPLSSQLYNHYLSEFDRRVSAYGRERMSESASRLRAASGALASSCLLRESPRPDASAPYVRTFETDPDRPWCAPYTRREVEHCRMIRAHQDHRVHELRLKGQIV